MLSHHAMKSCDFTGTVGVHIEAEHITVFSAAIGFDKLSTEPIKFRTTKVVHGLAPGERFGKNRHAIGPNQIQIAN